MKPLMRSELLVSWNSGIINTGKHTVSETGLLAVLR
jgi:hypothetical protein